MLFVDEFRKGIDTMLHPSKYTSASMGVGETFAYYYKLSFIPMVITIVLSVMFAGFGMLAAVLVPILALWIAGPIAIFVAAGEYHIFGKIFKRFKYGYARTLSAVFYSVIPAVCFAWLAVVPIVGEIVWVITAIWGFVMFVIALSKQQQISTFAVFGIAVLVWVITIAIVIIASLASVGVLAPSILSSFNNTATVP